MNVNNFGKKIKNYLDQTIKKYLKLVPSINRYVTSANLTRQNLDEKISENIKLNHLISLSRSPGLFRDQDDFFTERLMTHPVLTPQPKVNLVSTPSIDMANRLEVSERLITAYHKAIEDEINNPLKREGEDVWSSLLRNELPELIYCVERKKTKELAQFLKNFGKEYTWFGGITTCIDGYNIRNLSRNQIALTYLDKLVALAESIGALKYENPETGSWGENLYINIDRLIGDIENILKIDIIPPVGIIHTDGLAASAGIFHYRHINGLYLASRVAKLNTTFGPVCEIGGGLGIAALYARRLGYFDYTLLDLPIICLLASHYLIHALGAEHITLYGENPRKNSIKILPYWECRNLHDKYFEISINQDSLPEIADNLVYEYLDQIKRFTKSFFLSINHEILFPRTVNNFTRLSGGFSQIYRSKCWVREGYIEEAYKIVSETHDYIKN